MQEGRWAVISAQSTLTGNVVPARGTPRKGGLKEIRLTLLMAPLTVYYGYIDEPP